MPIRHQPTWAVLLRISRSRAFAGVRTVCRKAAGYPPPAKAQFMSAKNLSDDTGLYHSLLEVGKPAMDF
jgi:hypothetical protein